LGGGVVLILRGLGGRRKEAELLLESGGGFKEKEMGVEEEWCLVECNEKCECEVDNEKLKDSIVIVYGSREHNLLLCCYNR
jgi:hypothetical protein